MEKYKEQTIKGIRWSLVEQIVVYLTIFFGAIIMARLLKPEEFGLFGMLTVLGNLATLVVGMGISYSVINNTSLESSDLSSLFWANVLLGLGISLIFFFSASSIADFYQQPDLELITRWFCLGFIAQSFSAVPTGLLIKSMNFRSLAIANMVANLLAYFTSISLASLDFHTWSLVAHFLVLHFCTSLLIMKFSGFFPTAQIHSSSLNKVKKFSIQLLGSQLIDFTANNLDSVLIGKSLGKRDLGYYGRAAALVTTPIISLGYLLNRTFFPWFSHLQGKPDDLRHRYAQALRIQVLIIVPVLVLISMLSFEIVLLLFGPNWVQCAPYVSWLSVLAAIQCVNAFHDSFVVSQGRSDLLLRMSFLEKGLMVVAVFVGLRFGVMGVIWGKVAAVSFIFLPRVVAICRLLQISVFDWSRRLMPIMAGIALMGLVSYVTFSLCDQFSALPRLALVAVTGTVTYYLYLRFTRNESYDELQRIVRQQLTSWRH